MLGELVLRFVLGGAIVLGFAVLGEVLKPRSFAGIFGAAPSIALATLGLTFMTDGADAASLEGRSMIVGAAAFVVYSLLLALWLARRELGAAWKAAAAWGSWLVVAFGLWGVILR